MIASGAVPEFVSVAVWGTLVFGQSLHALPPLTKYMSTGASWTEPDVITILPVFELKLSGAELAVSVAAVIAGSEAGAVYVVAAPFAVMTGAIVPQPLEHSAPFCMSCQARPLAVGSNETVPANCCATFNGINALAGVIETVTAGTVRTVVPGSRANAELALSVTCRSVDGGVTGAV